MPPLSPTAPPADRQHALRDRAYRLLARREHSAWELRRKLQTPPRQPATPPDADVDTDTTADTDTLIDHLLADLAAAGAQSDHRFAEHRCRYRHATGRGPRKLHHELTQHQIAPAIIQQAMSAYTAKWRPLAAAVCRKKFGAAPTDYPDWARQARFLRQRGFTGEQIPPYDGAAHQT